MRFFKLLLIPAFLLVFHGVGLAQRPYFVYLQTEAQEPFYVLLNKKNYSSSSAGHVILPGLTNGTYTVEVGFPGQNKTQEYRIVVDNADQGFIIKKFGESDAWGMVNIHSQNVQMSGSWKKEAEESERQKTVAAAAAAEEAKRQEALKLQEEESKKAAALQAEETARLEAASLEKARADSLKAIESASKTEAAKQNTEVAQEVKQAEPPPVPVEKTGAATVAATEYNSAEKKTVETQSVSDKPGTAATGASTAGATAATGAVLSPKEIARLQEEARRIDAQGKRDSLLNQQKSTTTASNTNKNPSFLDIDFTMPADSINKEASKPATKMDESKKTDTAVPEPVKAAEPAKEEIKAADPVKETGIESTAALVTGAAVVKEIKPDTATTTLTNTGKEEKPVDASSTVKAEGVPAKNPNCKAEASKDDVEMVRMLIMGEKQAEDGLEIARKALRIKCVSTAQLRPLVLLFEKQEDRYTLLDLAYRYTTDRQNYSALSDLLTDPYFLNRFKAMVQ